MRVQSGGKDAIGVIIHFDCSLSVPQKEKITNFAVDLNLTVAGYPRESSIDFKLRSHEQNVTFYPLEYKI